MTEGTEQENEEMEMLPPDDCDRAHLRLSSSEHRPYHQIPASKPKDQTPIEPREGLDIEAYPPLPQSEGVGIGGVQGYDKNPKNLPLGVPAQRRTEAGSRPAEVTRSPPTTTPKPSEESHGMGPQKNKRDPVVQLKRLHEIHLVHLVHLEDDSCDETIPVLDIDPQTQPLPVDPSDDEDLTGSMDRQKGTTNVPTDTQRTGQEQHRGGAPRPRNNAAN